MNREEMWQEFRAQEESIRGRYFSTEAGHLKSVIFSQQFDRDFLSYIFRLADAIRRIQDTKDGAMFLKGLLPHKRAMLYFAQPSTRTRLSFESACHILGMDTSLVSDISTSSEFKGESPLDTVQTFSEYFDLIIMRHPEPGFVEKTAWHLSQTRRRLPVINAGSSQDQHPTQSILDFYTLHRHFHGDFQNKVIGFVGDLRSRTVRSNAYLARNYPSLKLIFCAPKEHQVEPDVLQFLEKHQIEYEVCHRFTKREIEKMHAVYMTRLQNDKDLADPERAKRTIKGFGFGLPQLRYLRHDAIVMHPLPRRAELSTEVDFDPRIKIWSEVRNGMWTRPAEIAIIFGVDRTIRNQSPDLFL